MRFIRVVYAVAIAVVLVLLIIFGIEAFYPSPGYSSEAAIHARNVFLIVLPLGAVFSIVGTFTRRRLDIFGTGLILGGIGTMIYSITPYKLDDMLKFTGIAVTLAVLVFVGYKVFFSLRNS
jgi:hypothetical protein